MEWVWEITGFVLLAIIGVLIYLFRVPGISTERDRLIIQYSRVYRILTLFANLKRITIDRSNQMVVIDRRILWIYSTQRVLYFEDLDHIDFSHKTADILFGDTDSNSYTARTTYIMSLVDKNHEKYEVFSLKCSGTAVPGSIEADDVSFISSAYGDEARNLVSLLKSYTGLSVGSLVYELLNDGMHTCPHCGQKLSMKKPTCLYCGKKISL